MALMTRSIACKGLLTAHRRFASAASPRTAFAVERAGVKQHAEETSDLWRKISIYVCIPALLISGLNAYNLFKEHQAHLEHAQHDEEELKEYPYQNIRVRKFFWGDGDKTLFWNPKVNHHVGAEDE